MKASLFIALSSLLYSSLAQADQSLSYPKKGPLVSFTAPDDWEAEMKDTSLFVLSPDGGDVIIEVMTMEADVDDQKGALEEAKSTVDQDFKELTLDHLGTTEAKGLTLSMYSGNGTDKHGEALINMLILKHPSAKHPILFSIITSMESASKYAAATTALMDTIKATDSDAAKPMAGESTGAVQKYSFPDKDNATFEMDVPADWTLEADAKGAWISSTDKKFTMNVIPIDVEHIEDGMTNITQQVSSKYDEVVWNEGGEPKVHIDEATGNTLISSEGVGKGGGYDHKLGVYQFAKKGSEKFFILSAWSPLKLADGPNGEAALKMLMSVKLH
jgi:hypothetical protein